MVQVVEQLVPQSGSVGELSSILGPTQNQQLFQSLSKLATITSPNVEHVATKIHRDSLGIVSLSWSHTTTYPSLKKGYVNMLHTSKPIEISLRQKVPEFLSDFPPLDTQIPISLQYLVLVAILLLKFSFSLLVCCLVVMSITENRVSKSPNIYSFLFLASILSKFTSYIQEL